MAKSRSPLVIIFITIFIDLVGFGLVIPILPLYAQRYGASETTVGILLAIYSAMQFVFAPILGRISDRVGRRPVLLVSLIGTAVGFLLMGLAPQMPFGIAVFGLSPIMVWLFLARIIDGISGGNISTAQAYVADVTPPEHRSRGMGLIGAAFGLGFVFGPLMAGVLSLVSPSAPFFVAAAMSAANATALYFFLPESLSHEHRAAGRTGAVIEIFKEAGSWQLGAVLSTYFFATVSFAIMTTTYSLFAAHRFRLNVSSVAYLFVYVGVIGAVVQGGLIGRLVAVFGDKPLAVAGASLLSASLFYFPLSGSVPALMLATTGLAVGNSLMTPTLNGLASKSVNATLQGRVLGVLTSVASLARIIGPVLGGWLLDRDVDGSAHYGRTPYWTSAAIMVVALGLALTVREKAGAASEEAVPIESRVG